MSIVEKQIRKSLKKGFFAGVGLGVTIGDTVLKTVDALSEKGEQSLHFSKVDNKELKHKSKADKK